ncbi:MAG TPA: DUF1302 family protein, partial [Telluria sp.]|nr:DUF1302 family protein [Telluria sp.]
VALAWGTQAHALDTSASGRIMAGAVWRVQARDPALLTGVNAAAIGLAGTGSGGNADDANTNYARGDAVSTAVHAFLDLNAREGSFAALVRIKGWYDYGLIHDGRPWGNVASRYAAGQPLSDAGAPRLSRFSGVALGDAWLQHTWQGDGVRLVSRLGQQSLGWGERSGIGGFDALNPRDLPAMRRAGASPQETRAPAPMLFERLEVGQQWALEGYRQGRFTPNALDMCGTLWSMSDYLVSGCDLVMSGQPQVSDRARIPLGATMKRLPTPKPAASEYGIGLQFKPQPGTELGLYHARYTSRTAFPGLRRSTRNGPALVAGDPDGRNMAYFTEYPEGLAVTGFSFSHKAGRTRFSGEASYRPRAPFMLSPGDVVPAFLSATAPSLLRQSANAVPPGGIFHGYDLYAMAHLQAGVQREWSVAGVPLTASAEVVAKHTPGLPAPSVRRYNRADIFGVGPVSGNCTVTTGDAARQCSLDGYVTPDAFGYRLRLEARMQSLLPGLNGTASVGFSHDVKGWSGDFLVIQGRKAANVALRFDYRQRYLAELVWQPNWGGDYNPAADRDTLALAVGLRF